MVMLHSIGNIHFYLFTEVKENSASSGGGLRGVMVKAMDWKIIVRKFVFQSRYYIHFRANTLGKGMNLLILPAMS